jgi:hypothetical protein
MSPDLDNFRITMAYDAFRIALGLKPRNHSVDHVLAWMKALRAREATK